VLLGGSDLGREGRIPNGAGSVGEVELLFEEVQLVLGELSLGGDAFVHQVDVGLLRVDVPLHGCLLALPHGVGVAGPCCELAYANCQDCGDPAAPADGLHVVVGVDPELASLVDVVVELLHRGAVPRELGLHELAGRLGVFLRDLGPLM
jgi:hypothetical protein